VGFLIRGRAGKAVERVRTRRLFWGILNNGQLPLQPQLGYTFLFHRHFSRTKALLDALNKLVTRIQPL